MNNKAIIFIRNFSYALLSNLVSLLVSTLIVLIIPKIIGVKEYGYWQLYLFYSSYVGFLQFGWNDGIYLRYGGKNYDDLDKIVFFSQFWMLAFSQIIITLIIIAGAFIFISDVSRRFIINMVALCVFIMGVRAMPLFILQATNKIKKYAQITIMDKIVYCSLIIIFIIFGIKDYKIMVISDLTGKFISLMYAVYCCRKIVLNKISDFCLNLKEAYANISSGIKLMFANIASMLIIGVVRYGIEHSWDVETFGKISLTLSISNMLMLFINAIGIIMFPILKRTKKDKLSRIYLITRDLLMIMLLGVLIIYYPLKIILEAWLPKYSDSLMYMALVFPMCVYEGKMSLLINTYLKTLRKEKFMLKINIISLVISSIGTFFTTIVLRDLDLAILSIVIILAFRTVLAELFLSRLLKISFYKDIILELLMTFIFISTGWFINSWITSVFYVTAYIGYLFIKRKDIKNMIIMIKKVTSI